MKFPTEYPFLAKNKFSCGAYSIVPIRYEDRLDIMKWRNEQVYHLRQSELLTEVEQDNYFKTIVGKLFEKIQPEQILFSYLKNGKCVGYGGLVHINWTDKNAEISFIMNTALESKEFELHWVNYLSLIEKIAFQELELHKIFTYAFDLRPYLYQSIEKAEFVKEAVLKEHCLFDGKFKDVIVHSKYNSLVLRKCTKNDIELLYVWANDKIVRENAFNTNEISWKRHLDWFSKKMNSNNSKIFILELKGSPLGQIRIDKNDDFWEIDYAVDKDFRNMGYGTVMLKKLIEYCKFNLSAEVKKTNFASQKVFINLGFEKLEKDSKFVFILKRE